MKSKDLEQLIENCEGLISERSDLALKKVAQTEKYQENYQEYSNLYEELIKKIDRIELERFANSIYALSDLENDYIYMQGFVDGIILKENLSK